LRDSTPPAALPLPPLWLKRGLKGSSEMRELQIRIIPNARQNKVLEEEGHLKVYVMAPPDKGRANKALVELLADHFGVKKSSVRIIKGEKSRDKIIEIDP
jgi:uncharacterized protein